MTIRARWGIIVIALLGLALLPLLLATVSRLVMINPDDFEARDFLVLAAGSVGFILGLVFAFPAAALKLTRQTHSRL